MFMNNNFVSDYGVTTDHQTVYVNASTCNLQYRPLNYPVYFDMVKVSQEMDLEQKAKPEWSLKDPRSDTWQCNL